MAELRRGTLRHFAELRRRRRRAAIQFLHRARDRGGCVRQHGHGRHRGTCRFSQPLDLRRRGPGTAIQRGDRVLDPLRCPRQCGSCLIRRGSRPRRDRAVARRPDRFRGPGWPWRRPCAPPPRRRRGRARSRNWRREPRLPAVRPRPPRCGSPPRRARRAGPRRSRRRGRGRPPPARSAPAISGRSAAAAAVWAVPPPPAHRAADRATSARSSSLAAAAAAPRSRSSTARSMRRFLPATSPRSAATLPAASDRPASCAIA